MEPSKYPAGMEPRLAANRANWDERVVVHVGSAFYDLEGWLRERPGPNNEEAAALGDLRRRSLLHLQCHFGMDTLRLARGGAVVTGVDFSPAAITAATSLAERSGLTESATFICANVYDAPSALSMRRFDVVYVSLGSLCWLPDVRAWGQVVRQLLEPGGQLYVHDVHPLSACLDDDGLRVTYPYFEDQENPLVFDNDTTYTDGGTISATRTYEWSHSLSEIVTALISQGLVLDALEEHPWTEFQQYPYLERSSPGRYTITDGCPKIPLSFTLVAHRPN